MELINYEETIIKYYEFWVRTFALVVRHAKRNFTTWL
jgi:hypothetical protein